MEQTMHIQLKASIDLMKSKVYQNLKEIEKNDSTVRNILGEQVSETRTLRLKKWLDKNRSLMEENKELVSLQISMLNYLAKFYTEVEKGADKVEVFKLTVDKVIQFDQQHPFYDNEEFRNELLNYYTEQEDYEMCAEIFRK
jgi:hypothetical protein